MSMEPNVQAAVAGQLGQGVSADAANPSVEGLDVPGRHCNREEEAAQLRVIHHVVECRAVNHNS